MRKYLKYKGIMVNHFGLPVFNSDEKEITKRGIPGRKYFQYCCFIHNFPSTAKRDLIVMYDIPSSQKKEREWFRRQLQKFNYLMI